MQSEKGGLYQVEGRVWCLITGLAEGTPGGQIQYGYLVAISSDGAQLILVAPPGRVVVVEDRTEAFERANNIRITLVPHLHPPTRPKSGVPHVARVVGASLLALMLSQIPGDDSADRHASPSGGLAAGAKLPKAPAEPEWKVRVREELLDSLFRGERFRQLAAEHQVMFPDDARMQRDALFFRDPNPDLGWDVLTPFQAALLDEWLNLRPDEAAKIERRGWRRPE